MKVLTVGVAAAVAAGLVAAVYVAATAAAAPSPRPVVGARIVITEATSHPGAGRTLPPDAKTDASKFEQVMDQPAEDADGRTVAPQVIVKRQGN